MTNALILIAGITLGYFIGCYTEKRHSKKDYYREYLIKQLEEYGL